MREEVVLFGKTTSLVGILTNPPEAERGDNLPAIILLNAGIVHRVGPNRLYVKIARHLAALGFVALRFDLSGIGDSPVRGDHLPFDKSAVSETQESMNYLRAARGVEQFVLMGICSGANLSFKVARCDPRVVGAVLINGRRYLHDNDELNSHLRSRALARHYWRIAFFSSFSARIWLNIITGKIRRRSVGRTLQDIRLSHLFIRRGKVSLAAHRVAQDMRLLTERGVRLLQVYSEGDEALDYMHVVLGDKMQEWRANGMLTMEVIRGANHTFTLLWSQEYLLEVICEWVQAIYETDL